MSQKKLLIISSILFVIAITFLFWKNDNDLNPQNNESFWNISFESPERRESLEFTIENFSDDNTFNYVITSNKEVLEKNTVKIEKTRKATVKPLVTASRSAVTTITVTHNNETKELTRK